MANLNFKTANRSAIHYSQIGALYNKFGEPALMLRTTTQILLDSGYTPYTGKKDVLKALGVRQVINASPGMHDLYTLHYEPSSGTGYIGKINEEAHGLSSFVNLLEAKNMIRSHVYCDTSITGNCLLFAFYNRPNGTAQSK